MTENNLYVPTNYTKEEHLNPKDLYHVESGPSGSIHPSKEAVEAAYNVGYHTLDNGDAPSWFDCQQQELEAAYAIDVAPLEKQIEELKEKLKHFEDANTLF
jgi:hypothetical protein